MVRGEGTCRGIAVQKYSRKTEALNASYTLDQNRSQVKTLKFSSDLEELELDLEVIFSLCQRLIFLL